MELPWNFFQWTIVIGVTAIAAALVLGAILWHGHQKTFRVRFKTQNGKACLTHIEAADIGEAVERLRKMYPGATITRKLEWNRRFWGVEFKGSMKDNKPSLLGSSWRDFGKVVPHTDEPTRVMLFTTRRAARQWCREKHQRYADRQDCCADWRFRPIRVQEIVRKIKS